MEGAEERVVERVAVEDVAATVGERDEAAVLVKTVEDLVALEWVEAMRQMKVASPLW